jgi:hypothetical protein
MVYGRRKPENGKEITFFTNLDIIQEMWNEIGTV